jgi:hypothetical protein
VSARPGRADVSWRDILSQGRPLLHVLAVSLHRVQDSERPADRELLSASCTHVQVPFLTADATQQVIHQSFGAPIDRAPTLYGLLHAETGGSPLYLRVLLDRLVSLMWDSS